MIILIAIALKVFGIVPYIPVWGWIVLVFFQLCLSSGSSSTSTN